MAIQLPYSVAGFVVLGFLVFRGIRSYVGYTNELFGVRNHKTLGSAIEFQ